MSYFERFFQKEEPDKILLVREKKNNEEKKDIITSSVASLLDSYSQKAKAKSEEAKTPKYASEKKDDFLEGFNDPYGEKESVFRKSLTGRMFSEFAKSVEQTPKTPTIKKETRKNTAPYIESFRKYNSDKKLRFPNAEIHATSNNDDFLNGFNDPYGENNTWEEQEENVNPFQRDMTGIAPMGRQKSMWCWIAAASMVDEYYHPEDSASQQEIADQLGKIEGEGGYIDEDPLLGKGSRSCATSGFSDRIPAKELTYEKIQEELHGKHPIVLLTDTGDDFKDEHYVVIVGCYTDGDGKRYVVVNETREDRTDKKRPGLQCHIPYEQIKGVFSTGRGADQRISAFHTTRPEKDSQHK